ncbi:MAG: bifunctional hydroxymethylpyrimidine kinase/phosphomethylpyrimidine kinase [Eubacterium sp.]|nr:bifunctional hydroxymethylpyrimidine kinase/phosphomethylpyrimidine kinase [Eubacterium sp.]
MKKVLTIAGSDSGGGAGIQADIKTMTMNGVYAMSVVTALTAQNTLGISEMMEIPSAFLEKQMDAVFKDLYPDAVKIGMVLTPEQMEVIADRLHFYKAQKVVVDPVMVATSGTRLAREENLRVLKDELLPRTTLLTPNIPEAEVLTETTITDEADMETAAKMLSEQYGCAVLIKGGHSGSAPNDVLYSAADHKTIWFSGTWIQNPNTHGTGCTLSSAIAANLAKGYELAEAIEAAKKYLTKAIEAMLDLGAGNGPLAHNYALQTE